jgi:hypothetical protein
MASSPVQAVAREAAPEEPKEGVPVPFNSPPPSPKLSSQSAAQPAGQSAAIQPSKLTTQSTQTDYSVSPPPPPQTDYSVSIPERKEPSADVVDLAEVKARLSSQSAVTGAVYDKSLWKRSRIKPGYLIKRIAGYNIAETEYGVSYLTSWPGSRIRPRLTTQFILTPGSSTGKLWKAWDC